MCELKTGRLTADVREMMPLDQNSVNTLLIYIHPR